MEEALGSPGFCDLCNEARTVYIESIKPLNVTAFFNNGCGVNHRIDVFKSLFEMSFAQNAALDDAIKVWCVGRVKVETCDVMTFFLKWAATCLPMKP